MNAMPDLSIVTLKMVISLVIVLAIIWGLYRAAKKNLAVQGNGQRKMIRVLENQYLGIKKSIAMVEVPGAVLVLGISSDRVSLLSQINDPAIINGITAKADTHRSILSFKDQLQRLTRSKHANLQTNSSEKVAQ
jgi:flagellar protein FliO/FliZ